MKHYLPHILAALSLLTLTVSCGDDSCYENGSSLPLATFYLDGSQQDIAGLTVVGIDAPGDEPLLDSVTTSEIYLPLRASVHTTAFRLWRWTTIDEAYSRVIDTISIDYEPIEFFHSTECGAMFNFDVKQVRHTGHGIDSVEVLTPLVTNAHNPALRIHFTNFNPS